MRRKKKRDIGDLSPEEYRELKRETDERIARDYAPGNIVKYVVDSPVDGVERDMLGICFLDSFVTHECKTYVTWHAVFQNGAVMQLGYNTFEKVVPTGEAAVASEWIAQNVRDGSAKRKKRNT